VSISPNTVTIDGVPQKGLDGTFLTYGPPSPYPAHTSEYSYYSGFKGSGRITFVFYNVGNNVMTVYFSDGAWMQYANMSSNAAYQIGTSQHPMNSWRAICGNLQPIID